MSTSGDTFQQAVEAHRGGRLDDARRLYEQTLRKEPRHADALNLLGFLLSQTGHFAPAVDYLRRAVECDPSQPVFLANLAEAHRGVRQPAEAIACYQRAIALAPSVWESHNNLGTLLFGEGRLDDAAGSYQRAVELNPASAECHYNLGLALQRLGRLHAALQSFAQAVRQSPNHFRAQFGLGGIHLAQQNWAAARQAFEQAAKLEPRSAAVHLNLGGIEMVAQQPIAAEAHFSTAIALDPQSPLGHFHLGNALQAQAKSAAAIASYRQAVALDPNYVDALCNLGMELQTVFQYDEAIAVLDNARRLRPDFSAAHCNLGVAYQDRGQLAEARACFERALQLEPNKVEFQYNYGTLLRDLGDIAGAVACFEAILRTHPQHAKSQCARGKALLSIGQFRQGFLGYEARSRCPSYDTRTFPQPLWDGGPLGDRTLLVHCEQGLGDTLQFIRYLRQIGDRGGRILVAVQSPLLPLLVQSGYQNLISRDEPLPAFDVHAPLLSLPYIVGTDLATVPNEVPYLAADPARVARWRNELARHEGFKVGFVWQGRADFRGDRLRSMPLQTLLPLTTLPGVRLFSLQRGAGSEQLDSLDAAARVIDLGRRIDQDGAFLDSAAIIANLDLVITTDTALAHLAGGLAARTWVAISGLPEWRWMLEREDSPWYPTMRLFRQSRLGDWSDVVARMASALMLEER